MCEEPDRCELDHKDGGVCLRLLRADGCPGAANHMSYKYEGKHEWIEVQFVYGGWTECLCGFRPNNQKEMDSHIPDKN